MVKTVANTSELADEVSCPIDVCGKQVANEHFSSNQLGRVLNNIWSTEHSGLSKGNEKSKLGCGLDYLYYFKVPRRNAHTKIIKESPYWNRDPKQLWSNHIIQNKSKKPLITNRNYANLGWKQHHYRTTTACNYQR